MAFVIPTLAALVGRARSAFSGIPGIDAFLPGNNVNPTAKLFGGLQYELFLRLDDVQKQRFVLWARGEWLDMRGNEFGLPRKAAQPASGYALVTAADAIVIPAGTPFARSDGAQFASSTAQSLSAAGTLSVAIVATTAGADSNTAAAAPLTIGAGPTGAGASTATAVVDDAGITAGTDLEEDGQPGVSEKYRGRILFRMRNPPHGGNAADYVLWASQVPGVTRVYVERRWRGPGTVRVFPVFDDLFEGGVADAAHVAAVIAAVAPEQPAVALVTLVAPEPYPIDVTISGLSPSTNVTQEAVETELKDAIRRLGRVSGDDDGVGLGLDYLATPHTFSLAWIWRAVTDALGVDHDGILAPTEDQVIPAGSIPVLGTVTFT